MTSPPAADRPPWVCTVTGVVLLSGRKVLSPVWRTWRFAIGIESWFPTAFGSRVSVWDCTATTYPPMLLVSTVIVTTPFSLIDAPGAPFSVNSPVRPVRLIAELTPTCATVVSADVSPGAADAVAPIPPTNAATAAAATNPVSSRRPVPFCAGVAQPDPDPAIATLLITY